MLCLINIQNEVQRGNNTGHVKTPPHKINPHDPRDYYALNGFKFVAHADYKVKSCYEVYVYPRYEFSDSYDWHEGYSAGGEVGGLAGFMDDWPAALQDAGLAEEYMISGYWTGPNKLYIYPSNWLGLNYYIDPISSSTVNGR